MHETKKARSIFLLLLIPIVVWVIWAISSFSTTLLRIERDSVVRTASETARSNAAQVRLVFERYTKGLERYALALEAQSSFHSPAALAYLEDLVALDGYARLCIDYPDGRVYSTDGLQYNALEQASDDGFSHQGDDFLREELLISDVHSSALDGGTALSLSLPLHDGSGVLRARLRATLPTATLNAIFNDTFFHNGGYYHLVDRRGNYVADGSAENALLMDRSFFEAIFTLSFDEGYSAEQIVACFREQTEGFSSYSHEGNARYAYYLPVGLNDWVLIMIVPSDQLSERTILHQNNSLLLCSQLVLLALLILWYVYHTQKKARADALLHERCFHAISEQTGKIFFELNFKDHRITSLSNFGSLFGQDARGAQTPALSALSLESVHPEDRPVFSAIFDRILQGDEVTDVRFRILGSDGEYLWSSLSGLVVTDARGRPVKAIGSLENIDEQVRTEQSLRQMAEKDALTGLYNKSTTEFLIKESLAQHKLRSESCALFIIDVDNFKNINDSFGHLYGDIVLSSLAETLKGVFRAGDTIGRIGGDEFFVFLQNCSSKRLLTQKAREVCDGFRSTYAEDGRSVTISASIGIAICPTHGRDFDELYRHADTALYHAKAGGKDSFFFYNGTPNADYRAQRTAIDEASSTQKSFRGNRAEYIFRLLYEAENTLQAIRAALQLLTEHFRFTRCYLFEFDLPSDLSYCTLLWEGGKFRTPPANLQRVPMAQCAHYVDPLREKSGYFYLRDRNALPEGRLRASMLREDALSMIQFGFGSRGKLLGALRFDDAHNTRAFERDEVDELLTICNVLATFLLKQRSEEGNALGEHRPN